MEKLIETISKLSGMLVKEEESAKEQFSFSGLTYTQLHYLEAINILINPNITELASFLKLTKPTVKISVDKLIEKDYIYKVQSDTDKRSAHIHLTEKGNLINQMHDYAHRRIAESIIKKLDMQETELFIILLTKILAEK
jgi:DNA-binding MarR family transcriptional regulator